MTRTPKPVLHRRDHEHGGPDPVRITWEQTGETGGGTGIQFDTLNEGGWLWVQTDDQTEGDGTTYGIELRDHSSGGILLKTFAHLNLESALSMGLLAHDGAINIESDYTSTFGSSDHSIQLKALTGLITITGDSVEIQGAGGAAALTLAPDGTASFTGSPINIVSAAGGGNFGFGGSGDNVGFVGATPAPQQPHPSTLADVINILQVFGFVA